MVGGRFKHTAQSRFSETLPYPSLHGQKISERAITERGKKERQGEGCKGNDKEGKTGREGAEGRK